MPDLDIPGKYKKQYTVNFGSLADFESIRADLLSIAGIEDVLFDERSSPAEMEVLTDNTMIDAQVQHVVAQHGFNAMPITLLILSTYT